MFLLIKFNGLCTTILGCEGTHLADIPLFGCSAIWYACPCQKECVYSASTLFCIGCFSAQFHCGTPYETMDHVAGNA
jgi:hypothetical protein